MRAAALVLALCGALAAPARAEPVDEFQRELDTARTPCRDAVFNLRAGNMDVVSFDLDECKRQWRALALHWAKTPPGPYAKDPDFGHALLTVAAQIEQARTFVERNQRAFVGEALDHMADTLREMRKRNNVVTLTDRVEAYQTAMEPVTRDPRRYEAAPPEQLADLSAQLKQWRTLAQAVGTAASPALARDPHFQELLKNNLDAIARAEDGVKRHDTRLLVDSLRELRSVFNLLQLRFG